MKMKDVVKGIGWIFVLGVAFLWLASPSQAGERQWVNPKEAIGPQLARLPQWKKGLTDQEKEEIQKYGYTGLELMTYVDSNRETRGKPNYSRYQRCVNVTGGRNIRASEFQEKYRFLYPDYRARMTYQGIEPGDMEYKSIIIITSPSDSRGDTSLRTSYLSSPNKWKDGDNWRWGKSTRKITRSVALNRQDMQGSMITTRGDDEGRELWEEEHRIIGEDILRGKECFVVESRHQVLKDYYLSKRVNWVEKTNFLDLHEEQFNREGQLVMILDKDWFQLKPGGWWFPREMSSIAFPSLRRTIHQTPIYVISQESEPDILNMQGLRATTPWIKADGTLPPITAYDSLPPEPKVRQEFWEKQGNKVAVAK